MIEGRGSLLNVCLHEGFVTIVMFFFVLSRFTSGTVFVFGNHHLEMISRDNHNRSLGSLFVVLIEYPLTELPKRLSIRANNPIDVRSFGWLNVQMVLKGS